MDDKRKREHDVKQDVQGEMSDAAELMSSSTSEIAEELVSSDPAKDPESGTDVESVMSSSTSEIAEELVSSDPAKDPESGTDVESVMSSSTSEIAEELVSPDPAKDPESGTDVESVKTEVSVLSEEDSNIASLSSRRSCKTLSPGDTQSVDDVDDISDDYSRQSFPEFQATCQRGSVDSEHGNKEEYQTEKVEAEKSEHHKLPFCCRECGKVLTTVSYISRDGHLYCEPHFRLLGELKAGYDEEDSAPPATTRSDERDSNAGKQKRNEQTIRESTCAELPPDFDRCPPPAERSRSRQWRRNPLENYRRMIAKVTKEIEAAKACAKAETQVPIKQAEKAAGKADAQKPVNQAPFKPTVKRLLQRDKPNYHSSSRINLLAQPKKDISKQHMWKPFLIVHDASTVKDIPPAALRAVPTPRVIELAQPKQLHKDYKMPATLPLPVPMPSSATPHVIGLANPKDLKPEYKAPVSLPIPVPKSALKAVASERVKQLAQPLSRQTFIHRKSPGIPTRALKATASERITELSKPKKTHPKYKSPAILPAPIPASALNAIASSRTLELSEPVIHRGLSPLTLPAPVPVAALKAMASSRICELARPVCHPLLPRDSQILSSFTFGSATEPSSSVMHSSTFESSSSGAPRFTTATSGMSRSTTGRSGAPRSTTVASGMPKYTSKMSTRRSPKPTTTMSLRHSRKSTGKASSQRSRKSTGKASSQRSRKTTVKASPSVSRRSTTKPLSRVSPRAISESSSSSSSDWLSSLLPIIYETTTSESSSSGSRGRSAWVKKKKKMMVQTSPHAQSKKVKKSPQTKRSGVKKSPAESKKLAKSTQPKEAEENSDPEESGKADDQKGHKHERKKK